MKGDNEMIRNKIIALVAVGCLTASIGITATAYTKNVSSKSKVNYSQAQKRNRPENGQKDIKSILDALVKAGTVTQAVEDKVNAYFTQLEADRKAEMDKISKMTAAERKTYMDNKVKTQKQDPLTDMVTKGTLTQAEANTLKTALPQRPDPQGFQKGARGNGPGFGNPNPADMKQKLDTLVTAGTITQAIEDKVISAYTQMDTDRKAEMDKIKNMTEAERKTYMDSKANTQRQDPLAALVKGGTLTQAQADAINKLQPAHHGGFGGHGGHGGFGGRH